MCSVAAQHYDPTCARPVLLRVFYPERAHSSSAWGLSSQCQRSPIWLALCKLITCEKELETQRGISGQHSSQAVSRAVKTADCGRIGGITGIREAC